LKPKHAKSGGNQQPAALGYASNIPVEPSANLGKKLRLHHFTSELMAVFLNKDGILIQKGQHFQKGVSLLDIDSLR